MSLINKMLNELEKNKKSDAGTSAEALSSVCVSAQKHKISLKNKVIGLALLLAIAIGISFHYNSALIKKKTAVIANIFKKPPAIPAKATEIIANIEPTIKLKNINLQTANDKTIVDFVLNAPTLYYIEHSADEQQLFVTLSDTGLLGNLPVNLNNTFIAGLNTKQTGTSTVCTLTLLPGTKIDELQLIDKPQPLLHLVLSNSQLTSSKILKVPTPVSPEQQEEQRYQDIQQLLAQNNSKKAITQLHLFVGDFPNNLKARETLAVLLINESSLQQADDILTIGLNKYPNHALFIKLKARVLVEQEKPTAAIDLLQKYSSSFSEDTEYLALLALLYQQQRQFIQAAELYNQLTKIQSQKAAWWAGLGIALESDGKKSAAKIAYNQAYGSSETTPELMAFLADKIKQ